MTSSSNILPHFRQRNIMSRFCYKKEKKKEGGAGSAVAVFQTKDFKPSGRAVLKYTYCKCGIYAHGNGPSWPDEEV